jgi:hypothetical protein
MHLDLLARFLPRAERWAIQMASDIELGEYGLGIAGAALLALCVRVATQADPELENLDEECVSNVQGMAFAAEALINDPRVRASADAVLAHLYAFDLSRSRRDATGPRAARTTAPLRIVKDDPDTKD